MELDAAVVALFSIAVVIFEFLPVQCGRLLMGTEVDAGQISKGTQETTSASI